MLKRAGLLAVSTLMSALFFTVSALVQPSTGTHPLPSAAALAERQLSQPILLAANSGPGEADRIFLPGLTPAIRPIHLGWNPQFISSTCQQAAVNTCASGCADIGECIFGCEIGGIGQTAV
jgi:hypothetical protein